MSVFICDKDTLAVLNKFLLKNKFLKLFKKLPVHVLSGLKHSRLSLKHYLKYFDS